MCKFPLLLPGLLLILLSTFSYAGDCTKDEILRFIDKGFSKAEINEICNKAKEYETKNAHLTKKLISAMTLNTKTGERFGDSGEAIQAYIKNGSLGKAPSMRIDYTDYWEVKNQVDFMGHTLVIIEEEYINKYIGCCVSPGIGITVKANKDINELKDFANINKCSFTVMNQSELNSELDFVGIKAFDKGKYVTLSCRERDATY